MTELTDILLRAQERKFLGSLPLSAHVANGEGFVAAIERNAISGTASDGGGHRIVDLGSGGGVPAFVIAMRLPAATFVLVERGERRAQFLADAATDLGIDNRVLVECAEAEDAARDEQLSGRATVVTARSFAPPAVTAECATRFLADDGIVIVSEPPTDVSRWSDPVLAELGLREGERAVQLGGTFQVLHRAGHLDDRYPRRPGTTRKRPLW